MRRLLEFACVIVGAALLAGGLWLLLVFAQYDTTYLIGGGALALAGLIGCVSVRAGRTRGAAVFVSLALVATVSVWAYARFAVASGVVETDPPSAAPEPPKTPEQQAPKEHPLDRALRLAKESLQTLDRIDDYTCEFDKEEWCAARSASSTR